MRTRQLLNQSFFLVTCTVLQLVSWPGSTPNRPLLMLTIWSNRDYDSKHEQMTVTQLGLFLSLKMSPNSQQNHEELWKPFPALRVCGHFVYINLAYQQAFPALETLFSYELLCSWPKWDMHDNGQLAGRILQNYRWLAIISIWFAQPWKAIHERDNLQTEQREKHTKKCMDFKSSSLVWIVNTKMRRETSLRRLCLRC